MNNFREIKKNANLTAGQFLKWNVLGECIISSYTFYQNIILNNFKILEFVI